MEFQVHTTTAKRWPALLTFLFMGAIGSESQNSGPAEVAGGILRELSDLLGLDKSFEVI
jgi:hypothetical protein